MFFGLYFGSVLYTTCYQNTLGCLWYDRFNAFQQRVVR